MKQSPQTQQRERHFKIEVCAILSVMRLFRLHQEVQTGQCILKLVKMENERFTVNGSRGRQNFELGNSTLLFRRLRKGNVLNCVPHVQRDYFFLFNQSEVSRRKAVIPISLLVKHG